LRARTSKKSGRIAPAALCARLVARAIIDARSNGEITAQFGNSIASVGVFGGEAVDWLRELRAGVPLSALAPRGRKTSPEIDLLIRRLAALCLIEYRLEHPQDGGDLIVAEPQVQNYWPQIPRLQNTDTLVLSRFAYMRRRHEIVLESPRAGALFKILDPQFAALIAGLASPQRVAQLRRMNGFPGLAPLALLVDGQILLKIGAADEKSVHAAESDAGLDLWEFHDLLFHARSSKGRHANPIGAVYPHVGAISPLPAVRPRWPGKKIELRKFAAAAVSPFARLLHERQSTRSFDDSQPITLAELSQLLGQTARVLSKSDSKADFDDGGLTRRPYPSAGASYELELYITVNACDGLTRGFYHYDADADALVPIDVSPADLETLLSETKHAMGAATTPQILLTMAARFGRVSWKYGTIAYALILKDVGVLTQTLYLAATEMELGGCAVGIVNIDLFARMTGIDFATEGPVGQFAIGRPKRFAASD